MTITLNQNRVLQFALGAAHLANLALPVLPAKYKVLGTAVLSILNWVTAEMAHKSNPDGTPAPTAAVPDSVSK